LTFINITSFGKYASGSEVFTVPLPCYTKVIHFRNQKTMLKVQILLQWAGVHKVGFEILTVARMDMAMFWVEVPCGLVEVYCCFKGISCLHYQGSVDGCGVGGSKYLQNIGKLLPDYTALQPRRQPSSL
jgi:hypothetical protein